MITIEGGYIVASFAGALVCIIAAFFLGIRAGSISLKKKITPNLILHTLSHNNKPLSSTEISKCLSRAFQATSHTWESHVILTAILDMQRDGLIDKEHGEYEEDAGCHRIFYTLSPSGIDAAQDIACKLTKER